MRDLHIQVTLEEDEQPWVMGHYSIRTARAPVVSVTVLVLECAIAWLNWKAAANTVYTDVADRAAFPFARPAVMDHVLANQFGVQQRRFRWSVDGITCFQIGQAL